MQGAVRWYDALTYVSWLSTACACCVTETPARCDLVHAPSAAAAAVATAIGPLIRERNTYRTDVRNNSLAASGGRTSTCEPGGTEKL